MEKEMKEKDDPLYADSDLRESSIHEEKRPRSKSKISLNRSFQSSRMKGGNYRFNSKDSDKRSVYSYYSRQSRLSKTSRRGSNDDSLNEILPEFPQTKR